jgi:DNA-binding MarR family transcriptional regulator
MNADEGAERESLLAELIAIQSELEASFVPELIEPVLSLRLTMQQLKVLTILVTEPNGCTSRSLAETMGVSLATMSGIVDRLESQGMAERSLDPQDQRVRRISATPLGLQTVQRLVAARPELSGSPLGLLAIDDLRALTRGVRALLRAVQQGSGAGEGPAADRG